jgi:cobalt-zinc-cadmium efflux system protein
MIITMTVAGCEQLLERIEDKLNHLNVNHMTIQLETDKHKHEEHTLCSSVQHSH